MNNIDFIQEIANKMYLNAQGKYDQLENQIIFEECIKGMQKIDAGKFPLILADPPFGIDFSGLENLYNRDSEYVVKGYHEISSDIDKYEKFSEQWISEIARLLTKNGSTYIFSGWNRLEQVLRAIRLSGLEVLNHIIWKYQFAPYTSRKYATSHRHILFCVKNKKDYYFFKPKHYLEDILKIEGEETSDENMLPNYLEIKRDYNRAEMKNGTKLPDKLVILLILASSQPADLIFDPFMGNATTAKIAKAMYRYYFGFEFNENMRETIQNNLSLMQLGSFYANTSKEG